MTGDDLKRVQDTFLEGSKKILREHGRLSPVGFVVTLAKNVDKLAESGWAAELIHPKDCVRDPHNDRIAALIVDLSTNWKKLYHAVVTVWPKTRQALEPMMALAQAIQIDDPYKRVMRPFLAHTQMEDKDVIAATMRHVCEKADAFASIFHSEAWLRTVDPGAEREADVPKDLGQDAKSIEVVISSMETREFTRMLSVPIHREGTARDEGKIIGFGDATEAIDRHDGTDVLEGRMVRFLKPLEPTP